MSSRRPAPANHSYLRDIGADEVIDYHRRDFTSAVADCDAVFATVGGEVGERSFAALKPGGRAAFIASGAKAPKPPRGDVQSLRPLVGRDRAHLDRLMHLCAAGAMRPSKITLYLLVQAAAAHRLSQSRHVRGKLVLFSESAGTRQTRCRSAAVP